MKIEELQEKIEQIVEQARKRKFEAIDKEHEKFAESMGEFDESKFFYLEEFDAAEDTLRDIYVGDLIYDTDGDLDFSTEFSELDDERKKSIYELLKEIEYEEISPEQLISNIRYTLLNIRNDRIEDESRNKAYHIQEAYGWSWNKALDKAKAENGFISGSLIEYVYRKEAMDVGMKIYYTISDRQETSEKLIYELKEKLNDEQLEIPKDYIDGLLYDYDFDLLYYRCRDLNPLKQEKNKKQCMDNLTLNIALQLANSQDITIETIRNLKSQIELYEKGKLRDDFEKNYKNCIQKFILGLDEASLDDSVMSFLYEEHIETLPNEAANTKFSHYIEEKRKNEKLEKQAITIKEQAESINQLQTENKDGKEIIQQQEETIKKQQSQIQSLSVQNEQLEKDNENLKSDNVKKDATIEEQNKEIFELRWNNSTISKQQKEIERLRTELEKARKEQEKTNMQLTVVTKRNNMLETVVKKQEAFIKSITQKMQSVKEFANQIIAKAQQKTSVFSRITSIFRGNNNQSVLEAQNIESCVNEFEESFKKYNIGVDGADGEHSYEANSQSRENINNRDNKEI